MYIWARRITLAAIGTIAILTIMLLCGGCEKQTDLSGVHTDSIPEHHRPWKVPHAYVVATKMQAVESHYNFLMSGFESETVFYLVTADGRKLDVDLSQWAMTSVGDTIYTERNWN